MVAEQREELVRKALSTPEGRQTIATSMRTPAMNVIRHGVPFLWVFESGDHQSPLVFDDSFEDTLWLQKGEKETLAQGMERLHRSANALAIQWLGDNLMQVVTDHAQKLPDAALTQEAFEGTLETVPASRLTPGRVLMNARPYAQLRKEKWFMEWFDLEIGTLVSTGDLGSYRNHRLVGSRLCEHTEPWPLVFSGSPSAVGVADFEVDFTWVEDHEDQPENSPGGVRMHVQLAASLVPEPALAVRRFSRVP